MRRHAGNTAGEDLAALSNEFFQQVRILVIDRLDGDVDPAARHRAIRAAESGTAFGSFGLHRLTTSFRDGVCAVLEKDCTSSFRAD